MRVLVVAWFYPPVTTSEAIVTYKLLSNSKFEYDVLTSSSRLWSYNIDTNLTASNIRVHTIDVCDLNVFADRCVEFYEKNQEKNQYDYVMIRSYPPESQQVGLRLKKKYPSIKLISSFGDPMGKNPYEIDAYIDKNRIKWYKKFYERNPNIFIEIFCLFTSNKLLRMLRRLRMTEKSVFELSDFLIFPSENQAKYSLDKKYEQMKNKVIVIPHSYMNNLYGLKKSTHKNEKFTFSYLGHLDAYRSPEIIIKAVKRLKEKRPDLISGIRVEFIGNVPQDMIDMVQVFFLGDVIEFKKPVDYFESLKIMTESDCLLHIDASFYQVCRFPIFFAAKIADYIGAKKHILGITPEYSTADTILRSLNCTVVNVNWFNLEEKVEELCGEIIKIIEEKPQIRMDAIDQYNAENVAEIFDNRVLINQNRGR